MSYNIVMSGHFTFQVIAVQAAHFKSPFTDVAWRCWLMTGFTFVFVIVFVCVRVKPFWVILTFGRGGRFRGAFKLMVIRKQVLWESRNKALVICPCVYPQPSREQLIEHYLNSTQLEAALDTTLMGWDSVIEPWCLCLVATTQLNTPFQPRCVQGHLHWKTAWAAARPPPFNMLIEHTRAQVIFHCPYFNS